MAKAAAAPAKRTTTQVEFSIGPSPDANQGLTIQQQAGGLIVRSKADHQGALEFIRSAKQLKRKIEDHWSAITRNVDELKRNLLDLKRKDVEPVETAIEVATRVALVYSNEEERRVREEQDRLRREAEARAQQTRERELAEQEALALKLEAESPALSAREAIFVDAILAGLTSDRAAVRAGYKDQAASSLRLMNTQKILDAIEAKKAAIAIREQAEAQRRQPLDVVTETVQKQVAKVAGTRNTTSWSAAVDDLDRLIDAVVAGRAPRAALKADTVYLNGQAEQLHEAFDTAFPGCRSIKKQGIAG